MYSKRAGLVLGFHGCDKSVADAVASKKILTLRKSSKPYDWLGNGTYFWENSLTRAIEFATELKENPRPGQTHTITTPAAIGAVLNLGFCLDLLDCENFKMLKNIYKMLEISMGTSLPENKPEKGGKDLLIRHLDCKVIESLHELRRQEKLPPFDSVRGAFWEGEPIYKGAGFRDKNHIQICIINHNCIKGYFHPRENEDGFAVV